MHTCKHDETVISRWLIGHFTIVSVLLFRLRERRKKLEEELLKNQTIKCDVHKAFGFLFNIVLHSYL